MGWPSNGRLRVSGHGVIVRHDVSRQSTLAIHRRPSLAYRGCRICGSAGGPGGYRPAGVAWLVAGPGVRRGADGVIDPAGSCGGRGHVAARRARVLAQHDCPSHGSPRAIDIAGPLVRQGGRIGPGPFRSRAHRRCAASHGRRRRAARDLLRPVPAPAVRRAAGTAYRLRPDCDAGSPGSAGDVRIRAGHADRAIGISEVG